MHAAVIAAPQNVISAEAGIHRAFWRIHGVWVMPERAVGPRMRGDDDNRGRGNDDNRDAGMTIS